DRAPLPSLSLPTRRSSDLKNVLTLFPNDSILLHSESGPVPKMLSAMCCSSLNGFDLPIRFNCVSSLPQFSLAFARSSPAMSSKRSEEHTSELQSRENLVCR